MVERRILGQRMPYWPDDPNGLLARASAVAHSRWTGRPGYADQVSAPPASPLARTRTDGHGVPLREVSSFLAVGLGLTGAYVLSDHRLGLPCPLRLATGLDCPLCGGTRMGAALLHGDVGAAWHYNAMALVGVSAVALWWAAAVAFRLGLVRRPPPRLPARWRRPALIAAVAVILAFSVARNLPVGPLAGWQV